MTTPAPESSPTEPVVTAGMDKEAIRLVIRDHIIPIRHCYEKELKTNKTLSGKLVLEWDIGDLGKVDVVRVKQALYPPMDECIAGVIKSALFPTPPKDQIGRVIFPFVFKSE